MTWRRLLAAIAISLVLALCLSDARAWVFLRRSAGFGGAIVPGILLIGGDTTSCLLIGGDSSSCLNY